MPIPNLIASTFALPYVAHKLEYNPSVRGVAGMPRRLLLIGHKDPSNGSASSTSITRNIATESDALAYFGENSMLIGMWRGAKANMALGGVIDALALDWSSSAVAASASIVVSSVPTANGEVMIYVGGKRYAVGVTPADDTSAIASRLVDAIQADPYRIVGASSVTDTVTLTLNFKGAVGNTLDLRNTFHQDDRMAAGVNLAISDFETTASGTTNPDLSVYVAAAANYRATEIVCPFTDSTTMGILETEQEDRWDCDNMRDGQVITVLRGGLSDHLTWLQPRNSKQLHSIHVRKDRTPVWVSAAMAGAAIESSASIDPVVPFTGIKLQGYLGAIPEDGFDAVEGNLIASVGGSVLEANEDSTANLLRMFTHYKRSPSGALDAGCRDLCWVKFGSYWRWYRVNYFNTRLRDGWKFDMYATQTLAGQKIINKALAEEVCLGIYELFMQAGMTTFLEHYQKSLLVELTLVNGTSRLKVQDEVVMVTQHYQTELTSNLVGVV